MEKRLLLAFVLSAVIFALWSVMFPPERPEPPAPEPIQEAFSEASEAAPAEAAPISEARVSEEPEEESPAAVAAEFEDTVRLANDVLALELSNRGAAVTSFELLGFRGDDGHVLDLIQTLEHPERSLPLQLVDQQGPDQRLYLIERRGPRELVLRWADGRGNGAEKTIRVPENGYGVEVAVQTEGELRTARLSVGTGLRDLGEGERNSRLAIWGDAALHVNGELEVVKRRKAKQNVTMQPQITTFAGFQDTYFLQLLRPTTRIDEIQVNSLAVPELGKNGKPEELRVLQLLVRPAGGVLEGELLGAPKEYDLVRSIGGGVEQTLDFGIFGPISVLFLKALWWLYGAVGNYGLAIILLTVGIRVLLFPLMHTSTVSMRKMQKLQPKVKEIQARHKKKKGDPQSRNKMNQEMMALYKQEGVNPMGGCLPMLVQLPILWALYKLFLHAIELRHAPFIFWIQDLSAKDPYYITPILMTASMWLQQRLAPMAGDPQQQRIMRLLPFIFGFMFLQFPSGLVLYWLTNNVLTIIQQELTLHLVGERKRPSFLGGGKGKTK
jgi:YidC/Oxa1 family membrane protein insertase